MRPIKFRCWDVKRKCWSDIDDMPLYCLNEVQESYIYMQYTGLKDAKGNMIWEGDVIHWNYRGESRFSPMVWNETKCGFYFEAMSFQEADSPEHWNVVGNIYENPDLLK